MTPWHRMANPAPGALALFLTLALASACATPGSSENSYRFFSDPAPREDPWYAKVSHWQQREREVRGVTQLAESRGSNHSGLLRVKMGNWQAGERMLLARRVASWSQAESRRHFRFDPPTSQADDPWPTTKDLLDANGDDCDGLDLIAYALLREFGFPPEQLYRAIVRRERDRANHMVTLWFEDPEDPWVVDASGVVTEKVRRFSELGGWTPTKVFNEREQYTPVRLKRLDAVARAR